MKVKNYLYILISLLATLNIQAQPSNDACTNAITITPNSCNPVSGTILNATQSISPISCNGTSSAAYDVWYKFVATSASHRIIVSPAANLDAVVDLRSGACTGTNIACADYGGGAGKPETINYTSFSIGSTYYIRIYASPGPIPSNPTFDIYVTASPAVTNDNCASAINLTPNSTCVNTSGSVGGATASGLAKLSCDAYVAATPHLKDVWYKFTSSNTGQHTVTITPNSCTSYAGFDAVLGIYSSCGGSELYCADNGGGPGFAESITFSATSGTTYLIRVYDYGLLEPTNPSFNICVVSSSGCATPSNPPNPTSNSPQCTSVTLTRGTPPGGITYYWQGTSCGTSTSNSNLTYNAASSGTYYLRAYNNSGSCWSTGCSSISVVVNSSSTAPSSASANPSSITSGGSSTLSLSGGSLGTGASWNWYSGSCGGSIEGQGNPINVSPTTTTTYYARAEGGTCGVTTSCVSVTVNVGTIVPTVSNITFTNVISNHPGINEEFELYDGLPWGPVSPVKICADGSAATKIKINVSNPNGIEFELYEGGSPVSSNSDIYGEFINYNITGNELEAIFMHPTYMPLNSLFRGLELMITYNGTPISGINFPINIYRAPVLFIHGWRGNVNTFELMNSFLLQNNYIEAITHRAAYPNNHSFNDNANVVLNEIVKLFKKSRSNLFSIGAVDIVAHSMGGILTRLYLQSDEYKFDIHKLITLNTPHSGTQGANFLYLNPITQGCLAVEYITNDEYECAPAIENMRVDNSPIDDVLNGSQLYNHTVPSYAITSTDALALDQDCFALGRTLYSIPGATWAISSVHSIFNFEANDLVVPLSSQGGGLTKKQNFTNQCHLQSYENTNVINHVLGLLDALPDASNFDIDGFSPPNLNSLFFIPTPIELPEQLLVDSIFITQPNYGANFNSGDTILIHSTGTSNINKIVISVGNGSIPLFSSDSLTNSMTVQYVIPLEASGDIRIISMGFDTINTYYAFDTLRINVNPNSILDSIDVYEDKLYIPVNHTAELALSGYYQDGIKRDILDNDSIVYDIADTSISNYIGNSKFYGKTTGATQLTISYQGQNISIPIEVYQGGDIQHALFTLSDTVICENNYIEFSDISLGNVINRSWQFPGGTPSFSTSQNPSIVYNTPGTYDVTLIATFPGKIDTLTIPNYITVFGTPTPSITPLSSTTFCSGNSVTIQTDTGSTNTYSWLKDGIIIQGASSDSYTATSGGNYQVIVTNNSGCSSASTIVPITVHPLPPAVATPNSSTSFCAGGSVVLNANSGSGLTYQWTKYGNAVNGATSSSYTATTTGSYKVRVTDSNGCSKNSSPVLVTSIPAPPASITPAGSTTICAGSSVALNANIGTGYTYKWYKYSNVVDSTSGSTFLATSAGKYRVLVTDNFGCFRKSQPVDIFVVPKPAASITASGATTFCAGSSVTLNANQGSGLTYQWYKYSNPINGATAATYQATATGNYKVEVTNSSGCKRKSNSILVTVLALPTATITPNVDTGFCTGDSVLLSAGTDTGYSYQWKRYGNNISGAMNQTYYASTAGAYKVTVTGPNGCTRNSPTINVSSPPSATITVNGSTSICPPDSVELVANISAGYSYQWYKNNTSIPLQTNNSIWVSDTGFYTVQVNNLYGCSTTSTGISISNICPISKFHNSYGDSSNQEGTQILFTYDNCILMLGNYNYTNGGEQSYSITKLNKGGDLIWSKSYHNGNNNNAKSIIQSINNSFIIVGETESVSGPSTMFITKIDSSGIVLWDRSYSNITSDCYFSKIIKLQNNKYAVIGGTGISDAYFLLIDENGNIIWSREYNGVSGASANLSGHDVVANGDSSFTIYGNISVSGSGTQSDIMLLKIDSTGNPLFCKTIGTTSLDETHASNAFVKTNDGGYILAARTWVSGLGFILVKVDLNGVIEWSKYYNDFLNDDLNSIIEISDGYLLTGETRSIIFLTKIDFLGNILWSRRWRSSTGHSNGMDMIKDNNYIYITGQHADQTIDDDYLLIKGDTLITLNCSESSIPFFSWGTTSIITNAYTCQSNSITLVEEPITFSSSDNLFINSILCFSPKMYNESDGNFNTDAKVYPNPAGQNNIFLDISSFAEGEYEINLFTIDGRLLEKRRINHKDQTASIYEFDISPYKVGLYYLQIINNQGNSSQYKFIIAK